MMASKNGHLDVVNRLLGWQKTKIREGFKLACCQGSLYFPADIIGMIVEFTVVEKYES